MRVTYHQIEQGRWQYYALGFSAGLFVDVILRFVEGIL